MASGRRSGALRRRRADRAVAAHGAVRARPSTSSSAPSAGSAPRSTSCSTTTNASASCATPPTRSCGRGRSPRRWPRCWSVLPTSTPRAACGRSARVARRRTAPTARRRGSARGRTPTSSVRRCARSASTSSTSGVGSPSSTDRRTASSAPWRSATVHRRRCTRPHRRRCRSSSPCTTTPATSGPRSTRWWEARSPTSSSSSTTARPTGPATSSRRGCGRTPTCATLVTAPVNQGLPGARNTALGLASAERCFVLDADNELGADRPRPPRRGAGRRPRFELRLRRVAAVRQRRPGRSARLLCRGSPSGCVTATSSTPWPSSGVTCFSAVRRVHHRSTAPRWRTTPSGAGSPRTASGPSTCPPSSVATGPRRRRCSASRTSPSTPPSTRCAKLAARADGGHPPAGCRGAHRRSRGGRTRCVTRSPPSWSASRCRSDLRVEDSTMVCPAEHRYPVIDGVPVFTAAGSGVERRQADHHSHTPPAELVDLLVATGGPWLNLGAGATTRRYERSIELETTLLHEHGCHRRCRIAPLRHRLAHRHAGPQRVRTPR